MANKSGAFKMDIEQLINLVHDRPILWDRTQKNHLNRFVTAKKWREISEIMDIGETKVRKKWKYLRDQFSIELAKVKSAKSDNDDSDDTETPKWCHFKHLLFLKDNVKPRQLTVNTEEYEEKYYPHLTIESQEATMSNHSRLTDDDDNSLDITNPTVIFQEGEMDFVETGSPNNSEDTDSYLPQILNVVSQAKQPVKKKRRKRKEREDDLLQENGTDIGDIQEETSEDMKIMRTDDNDDEDLLFLKSLLPHIRSIPANKKLPFRSRILEVVGQFAHYSSGDFSD